MKEYDSLSDNEKRNMLASVANLYYNAEMTQNQIAERFFTSPLGVVRANKIIKSECSARDIHTFCPFTI